MVHPDGSAPRSICVSICCQHATAQPLSTSDVADGCALACATTLLMDPAPVQAAQRREPVDRISRVQALQCRGPALPTGSELVASSLAALDFVWIAGVGGTPVHGIFHACAARGLRVFGTRTQAGATLMTAAAAFVAGSQQGAVVLSSGPAVTNAITGILVARDNGWPLLVLGGRSAVHDGQSGHFQQLDGASLIEPIAKWTACAKTPAEIPRLLREAVRIARSGRPGPVYIDLPADVLSARTVDPGPVQPLAVEPAPPSDQLVEGLAQRLRAARHPVLVLGDGLRWRLDLARVGPWLERLGLPVVALPLMRGLLAESHPRAVQGPQARAMALAQADLVVLFGADVDWRLRFGAEIDPGAAVILVDDTPCPAQGAVRGTERVNADAGLLLNRLSQLLHSPPNRAAPPAGNLVSVLPAAAEPPTPSGPASPPAVPKPLSIPAVFEVIRAVMPSEAFLVMDGKITLQAAQRFLPREHPFLHLDPGWNGCMGSGVPFAMAARLHHPSRPVLLVSGDLAFGMAAIELETAVRHHLPFVVLVINNDGAVGSLSQRRKLPPQHPERVHAFQPALGYEQLASGLGFSSCRVSTAEQLRHALGAGWVGSEPLLINTLVEPSSTAADGP